MPTAPVSQTQAKVVSEVLSKLLFVGITDQGKSQFPTEKPVIVFNFGVWHVEEDIRLCVLSNLDARFDGHLAQAENLNALFVALNDEVGMVWSHLQTVVFIVISVLCFQLFSVRELAICTIGRLSALNPAYVMPSLRKTLIQVTSIYSTGHIKKDTGHFHSMTRSIDVRLFGSECCVNCVVKWVLMSNRQTRSCKIVANPLMRGCINQKCTRPVQHIVVFWSRD